jgi:hypothetical protein
MFSCFEGGGGGGGGKVMVAALAAAASVATADPPTLKPGGRVPVVWRSEGWNGDLNSSPAAKGVEAFEAAKGADGVGFGACFGAGFWAAFCGGFLPPLANGAL